MVDWHLVNFLLNLTTCLFFSSLNWTFREGLGQLILALEVCPTCPGVGAHYTHCSAASFYFGEKLVISLKSSLFPTPLLMCLSHAKWSRYLCHFFSYTLSITIFLLHPQLILHREVRGNALCTF
jgi:hypothetical protein